MLHTEKRSLIPWTLKVCAAVLSLFGMSVIPMGAQSVLSGTVVTASDGQPIVGAYVLVKGTTVGTTTEVDGTFRIEASSGTILEVSQMGYVTRQVKASDGIRIALDEDQLWLDDVVVVGYGVQKKKLVTGSTVQVKGDDIAKLNTVDVLGALQSQSPESTSSRTMASLDPASRSTSVVLAQSVIPRLFMSLTELPTAASPRSIRPTLNLLMC